jgi:hypothetical protein
VDECCACVDESNSPIWGFAGPTIITSHQGCHGHDGGAVLIRLWRGGAPVQEGPPLVLLVGVHPICAWGCPSACATPISLVHVLNLKSDA